MIQGKANEDSQSLQQLQASLNQCKTQLQNALQEYDQSKTEHQKLIESKTKSIDFLTDDLNIKTKHITEIEESYKKALEMLEQSQKRITELEDSSLRHVNDFATEKQTNEELNQEIQHLHQKISDLNGDIDLYQGQVDTMNQALDEAKHKFKVCLCLCLLVLLPFLSRRAASLYHSPSRTDLEGFCFFLLLIVRAYVRNRFVLLRFAHFLIM